MNPGGPLGILSVQPSAQRCTPSLLGCDLQGTLHFHFAPSLAVRQPALGIAVKKQDSELGSGPLAGLLSWGL